MSNVRKISGAGSARDLRRSEQDLSFCRHMVAAMKSPMYFVDTDYIFREVNQAFVDVTGMERSSLIGHHVTVLVGERHFLDVSKPDLDRCFSGTPVYAQRWVEFLAQGRGYVEVHFDPSRNDDGEIHGAVISLRDITEQKHQQDALIQSDQQLRAIFDNSPSEIYLKDA